MDCTRDALQHDVISFSVTLTVLELCTEIYINVGQSKCEKSMFEGLLLVKIAITFMHTVLEKNTTTVATIHVQHPPVLV